MLDRILLSGGAEEAVQSVRAGSARVGVDVGRGAARLRGVPLRMGRAAGHRARAQAPPRQRVGGPPPRARPRHALARAQPRRAARPPARHTARAAELLHAAAAPTRRLRQPTLLLHHHLRHTQSEGHGAGARDVRPHGTAHRPVAGVQAGDRGGALEVSQALGAEHRARRRPEDTAARVHRAAGAGEEHSHTVGEPRWHTALIEVNSQMTM